MNARCAVSCNRSMFVWLIGVVGCIGIGCGGSNDPNDCPGGICPRDASSVDATGVSDGNPECVENWICSPWSTDGSSDNGVRTCVDEKACGTTANKPAEAATLPALDFNYYKCNVEPIMDWGCSMLGCHGTEQGRALRIYARGRLRITGETLAGHPNCLASGQSYPSESCIGSIECHCWLRPHFDSEWRANYDSARGFALRADGTPIPSGNEAESELLAQPLVGGGYAHAGIHMFQTNDARYTTIRNWLAGATLATCTTTN